MPVATVSVKHKEQKQMYVMQGSNPCSRFKMKKGEEKNGNNKRRRNDF